MFVCIGRIELVGPVLQIYWEVSVNWLVGWLVGLVHWIGLMGKIHLSHAKVNGSFWMVVWAYQHPFSFENLFPNFQIFFGQKDDRSVAEYFYAFELGLDYCFQLDSNEYHDGKITNKGRCDTTFSLNKV